MMIEFPRGIAGKSVRLTDDVSWAYDVNCIPLSQENLWLVDNKNEHM